MGAIAVVIGTALMITPAAHHHQPTKVVVSENYVLAGGRINVHAPQRLDVIMNGTDHVEVLFCEDMGGEPILYPANWNYRPLRGRMVCEGVDY